MPLKIIDNRFEFKRNPFNSQQVRITPNQDNALAKLKAYIEGHPSDFIAVNPVTSIKYVKTVPESDLKFLCGIKKPYEHEDIDDFPEISNNVKKFIAATQMPLFEEMRKWIATGAKVEPEPVSAAADEYTPINDFGDVNTDAQPNEFMNFLDDYSNENRVSTIAMGLNYDNTSDKKLDYNEVCSICLDIAKTYNNNNINIKDPSIIAIENKRRRDLLNNIARYRRNREIAAVCTEEDLTKLSIEQLETVYAECEQKFGQLKLKEVSRQMFGISSKAYDMLLPQGIPIGKGKHVTFNGVGDEIIKELHNSSTAVGLAYDNFIQKHNIKISDELSILAGVISIFIKNIKVVKDKTPEEEEEEGEEGEEEDEEEAEEELQEI